MKTFLSGTLKTLLLLYVTSLPFTLKSQWSSPVNISPNAVSALLNESMGPCIGVSSDTVHVVWADRLSAKKGAIYYTQSADTGTSWTNAVPISDLNANAFNPAIAVNGRNIHVVWRTVDTVNNAHRTSWYKHSLDGGVTWGPAIVVDTSIADWPAVAVSGDIVYVANDIVTSSSPYNTEIFFIRSLDNGDTWSSHQQITNSAGRSEDEAIAARGSDVYMSWNDNRNGPLQIFCKHSGDAGLTWDPDVLVNSEPSYGTMVSIDGQYVDIPSTGASSGHYQVHLNQSGDGGSTWGADMNLSNDPANTYYYPYMVRDSSDLHMTYVKSGTGGQYLHSSDGGVNWDTPYSFGFSNITPFIAYTGCMLHVIVPDSGRINYFRNPTGNAGPHCGITTGISNPVPGESLNVFPNPGSDQVYISIPGKENCELTILNSTGQPVLFQQISNTGTSIPVDISRFNAGLYVVHVTTLKTGHTSIHKFLKD